jgi:superfamily II DNA or RNA helicase
MLSGGDLQNGAAKAMRALIDAGILEMRFAVPTVGAGILHDKTGIFTDEVGNVLVFTGSANESATAWSGFGNHEQIEVYRAWLSDVDEERVSRHQNQFEEMWLGLRRGLRLMDASLSNSIIRTNVPAEPLEEILQNVANAIATGARSGNSPAITLRDYQTEVLDDWDAADQRGIIEFATGGGKTRTALEAVRRWTATGRPAVITVPTLLLHRQWRKEIDELLPEVSVLSAGAGHPRNRWIKGLREFVDPDSSLGARVTLVTNATASSPDFLQRLGSGTDMLLVSDEVHSIGASNTRRLLNGVSPAARLGLSATPQRYGDPSGTTAIFGFYGRPLLPKFDIHDAIERRVLVPYDYDFESCALLPEEQDSWDELSLRIGLEIARNEGVITEFAKRLLIKRARIVKRAFFKAEIARDILELHFAEGDRWLVYCGDIEHLHTVRTSLESLGIDLLEYHSETENPEAVLDYFTTRGGVLLAVKCLDEGIDIPRINRAIVLASSSNPREYVQRRGRILRKSPGKTEARLYDVLVVGSDGFAISPNEVTRAIEFAGASRNVAPLLYLRQLLPPEGQEELAFEEDQDV